MGGRRKGGGMEGSVSNNAYVIFSRVRLVTQKRVRNSGSFK